MRRIFVGLHEVVLRFVFLNSSTHLLIYIIILSFLSLSYGIIFIPNTSPDQCSAESLRVSASGANNTSLITSPA